MGSEVIRTRHTSPRRDSIPLPFHPCSSVENPEAGRHMENDQTVDHLYPTQTPSSMPWPTSFHPQSPRFSLILPALARCSIIDEHFPHSNRIESIYTYYYIRNIRNAIRRLAVRNRLTRRPSPHTAFTACRLAVLTGSRFTPGRGGWTGVRLVVHRGCKSMIIMIMMIITIIISVRAR